MHVPALWYRKTTGVDTIPAKTITHVANYVCQPLACIFNMAVTSGSFPDFVRLAEITPSYKKVCACIQTMWKRYIYLHLSSSKQTIIQLQACHMPVIEQQSTVMSQSYTARWICNIFKIVYIFPYFSVQNINALSIYMMTCHENAHSPLFMLIINLILNFKLFCYIYIYIMYL